MKQLVVGMFLLFGIASETLASPLKVGDVPPDYLGRDMEGNEVLLSDHKGKVVVVSFWATWCAPCLKELPVLEYIQKQIPDTHLRVIAVNYKEDKRALKKLSKALGDHKLLIVRDKRHKAVKAYGVDRIPNTFVIGKTGIIEKIHVGYGDASANTMIKELNVLLGK